MTFHCVGVLISYLHYIIFYYIYIYLIFLIQSKTARSVIKGRKVQTNKIPRINSTAEKNSNWKRRTEKTKTPRFRKVTMKLFIRSKIQHYVLFIVLNKFEIILYFTYTQINQILKIILKLFVVVTFVKNDTDTSIKTKAHERCCRIIILNTYTLYIITLFLTSYLVLDVYPSVWCTFWLPFFFFRLLQRYQNVKSELEAQQNLERTRMEKLVRNFLFIVTLTYSYYYHTIWCSTSIHEIAPEIVNRFDRFCWSSVILSGGDLFLPLIYSLTWNSLHCHQIQLTSSNTCKNIEVIFLLSHSKLFSHIGLDICVCNIGAKRCYIYAT